MNAEIVAIGTELLLGFTLNTDTAILSRVLAGLGIDCYHQLTVGDNRQRLAEALRTALSRADLVITCGGLGPTVDDITLETIASVTGRQLILNRPLLNRIKARFVRLGIRMPKANVRQAMIPQGAVVFPNQVGTAPGLLIENASLGDTSFREKCPFKKRSRLLVALPGPPAELIPMVEKHLIPRLRRLTGHTVIRSKTLKTTGLTESEVDAKVRDLLALKGQVTVGIYAHPAQVDLRITAKAASDKAADRAIAGIERKIHRRLGNLIFGADEETLEGVVGELLKKRGVCLGVAESCTGGLVQHRIAEIPGSSLYFRGGVVAYANQLKESPLGVSPALLQAHGAVSPQVAKAMAEGIRRLTQSDLGLGITGIAGPTGATPGKPVGLVFIALSGRALGGRALGGRKGAGSYGTKVYRYRFSGDRSAVKFKASQAALDLLRRWLLGSASPRPWRPSA